MSMFLPFFIQTERETEIFMKITKVLNNNAVLTEYNNNLIILVDSGIGFKKKLNQTAIVKDSTQKFILANNQLSEQIVNILENTPVEYFELSTNIFRQTESVLRKKMNPNLLFILIDHISFTIERYHKGIILTNALLYDIKRLYHKEFTIGQYAVELINTKMNVSLTEDETAFIAMHIMNNALENQKDNTIEKMMKIVHQILKIIEYQCSIDLDEESLDYFRLINHLKFFAQRVITKESTYFNEGNLLEDLRYQYNKAYSVSLIIQRYIEKEYEYRVSEEEITYLTIHIQRVIHST